MLKLKLVSASAWFDKCVREGLDARYVQNLERERA